MTRNASTIHCDVDYLLREELNRVVVEVSSVLQDIPPMTFPNSEESGTWIFLEGLYPGTTYSLILRPWIDSTRGPSFELAFTTVVDTPEFIAFDFLNETAVQVNLTIDGGFDSILIHLSLNSEILESHTVFYGESILCNITTLDYGQRYLVTAEAVAGPWKKESRYILDIIPAKPILMNEILLPEGGEKHEIYAVRSTFSNPGYGIQFEYYINCSEAENTSNTTSLAFLKHLDLEIPASKIGCKLLARITSYVSGLFNEYAIFVGYLVDVEWYYASNGKNALKMFKSFQF